MKVLINTGVFYLEVTGKYMHLHTKCQKPFLVLTASSTLYLFFRAFLSTVAYNAEVGCSGCKHSSKTASTVQKRVLNVTRSNFMVDSVICRLSQRII